MVSGFFFYVPVPLSIDMDAFEMCAVLENPWAVTDSMDEKVGREP